MQLAASYARKRARPVVVTANIASAAVVVSQKKNNTSTQTKINTYITNIHTLYKGTITVVIVPLLVDLTQYTTPTMP